MVPTCSNQRTLLDLSGGWPSARGCFTRWLRKTHSHQKKPYLWVYIYTIQLVVTVPSYLLILRFNPYDRRIRIIKPNIIAFLHILSHFFCSSSLGVHWGSLGLPQSANKTDILRVPHPTAEGRVGISRCGLFFDDTG